MHEIDDANGAGPARTGDPFLIMVIAMIIVSTYGAYLFYLQMVRGGEYQQRAVSISRQIEKLPAQRGEIYDRNNNLPLVLNVDSFAIVMTPAEVPAEMRDTVFTKLAVVLDEPVDELRRKVPPSYYRMYQQMEIASSVSQETVTRIAERLDEFPGISWYSRPKRNYLETGSFSHIIGFVGDISREELKIYYNKGYQTGDTIGKSGIERQYDEQLRGQDGRQYKTVDVRGRRVDAGRRDVDAPLMGKNLVLTIDRATQILAEKALGERIGSIVVLKPSTGEILALVSYPSYNANAIVDKGGNNEYAKLLGDPRTPLINRAIQSSYPPASTFKTIMTTAIIEEKAFPLDKKVLCTGEISYGDRVFRCWIRKPGHGPLNLQEALAQSCDVFFWEVGRDNLGIERIVSYAREFGFGQTTGIDLPGETAGFVPTPQWKERTFHEKWLGGDTLNMSIGQGYTLTTPLQLANMMAMVVNEGVIYRPHILKEVRDPRDGSIVSKVTPEVLRASSISKESFQKTKEYLRSVIVEGTARYPVSTKVVQTGGKTGTAEVGLADRWHSWFVGFGPTETDNPDEVIVVAAIIEAVNPWEWWAPYATNLVYQGYFGNQTYEEAARTLGLLGRQVVAGARVE